MSADDQGDDSTESSTAGYDPSRALQDEINLDYDDVPANSGKGEQYTYEEYEGPHIDYLTKVGDKP